MARVSGWLKGGPWAGDGGQVWAAKDGWAGGVGALSEAGHAMVVLLLIEFVRGFPTGGPRIFGHSSDLAVSVGILYIGKM